MPACCVQKIPPNAGRGLPEYLTVEASRCIQFVTDSITEPIHASKNIYMDNTGTHVCTKVPSAVLGALSTKVRAISRNSGVVFALGFFFWVLNPLHFTESIFSSGFAPCQISVSFHCQIFWCLHGLFLPSSCQDQTLTPMSLIFTWKIFRFQSQK